ncbi:sensor histidine kinase [Aporhodopirellula aestuarii]|uniref:histidine kinase n=1 Tax=Aporhodopirellula aestuarii TaxID=2950107 RepID=A0ABT0TZF5_9BACT|nr:ATP-binding protein [Aporhodopirellula aestuarii]MCM2369910.1 ATP-binding protein [Aporhodopirellula aestuarii]
MIHSPKVTSLKTLLHIGSGLLVAICLLSNVIGWVGQELLLSNFRVIESSDQLAADVLRVHYDALQLKARAENYAQTGADAQYLGALELQSDLLAAITQLKTRVGEGDALADMLEKMRVHIAVFGDRMELASAERTVRTELLQDKLLKQESEVDQSIAEFETSLNEIDADEASRKLLVAVRAYSMARKNLLRYFIKPVSEDYQQMLDALKRSQSEVQRIELPPENEEAIAAQQRMLAALSEFQTLGVRAVQATRGYMFYVNVVMAGEISEFVHYAKEINSLVRERREATRVAREQAVTRSRLLGVLASALAVVIAAVLAFRLSKVIFDPISGLTKTFLRLAQGETIDSIPAVGRNDEIGRMARAAEVFSRKNQQTKELLDRSQALSEELAQKALMLEESNQELDNFAYVASHDLKSPLRGLRCLAEWVQEDCDGLLSEDSMTHLQQMQARVTKMECLLDDLLNYSRVGRIEQRLEAVDVHEMVESILELLDDSSGVQVAIDGDLPVLETFRAPLQQVMLNLITNAVKYNDKGRDGRIQVASEQKGAMVRFSVSDNGIGIAPRFHERIFQMYQRASSLNVDGSGMGLAIVKKQIEIVGGQIRVDSTEGKGSTFSFTWPMKITKTGHTAGVASSV